jgi:hypothetical protein
MALLPRLWTSGPLVKSKFSTLDLPKSRKEQRNDVTSEIKNFTYIYKKCLNYVIVHYMATRPER